MSRSGFRLGAVALLLPLLLPLARTPDADANAAPVRKDRFYYEKKGEILWEVRTDRKLVAFTFDDGPDRTQTGKVLNLLGKYGAKCTFFVVGRQVAKYPEVARRIVEEGHEIANHTYSHAYFRLPSLPEPVRREIASTEAAIYAATGQHSAFFRPPGGIYDETIVRVANGMHLLPVMWSWHQDTRDWSTPGTHSIVRRVLDNLRGGDIVLFHDFVPGRTETIDALAIILPELANRGYRLVTVSELLQSSISEVQRRVPASTRRP